MKKTTKKIIALTAVLAMAASVSTMAFAADTVADNDDPNYIDIGGNSGSTKVILDVTSAYPDGIYTVQIPANVNLTYDPDEENLQKRWKNNPNNDLVKIAENSEFVLKENHQLNVVLAQTSIKLTSINDDSRQVDCACSMEDFTVKPSEAASKTSKVTFTAPTPSVAEKYTGSATFNVSTSEIQSEPTT